MSGAKSLIKYFRLANSMDVSLARLVEEQTRLQMNGTARDLMDGAIIKKTDRSRTIDEYSQKFGFWDLNEGDDKSWAKLGLKKLIDQYIERQGQVVWVDLGCGNAVALRQGKMYLEDSGRDPGLLRAYGIDALPMDEAVIQEHIENFPLYFTERLLEERYKPIFRQADISDMVFEERPDIVTCSSVMQWVEDPLLVFENAARQAKVGATLCLDRLNRLYYSKDPTRSGYDNLLFTKMFYYERNRREMEILSRVICGDGLIVRKTKEDVDFTFGFRLFHKGTAMQGFFHVYYNEDIVREEQERYSA